MDVLTASGPIPNEDPWGARVRHRRAERAAWDTYLAAGFACGLLDGEHGSDVLARLTGIDDDNFRLAMAECMVAWFFAARLR